jgi:putative ABC transport system permease protein
MLALSLGGFAIGAEGATIAFRPTLGLATSGTLVSVFVGILAGVAPAIQASTVPIVNALRQP